MYLANRKPYYKRVNIMNKLKKYTFVLSVLMVFLIVSGCGDDAQVASRNLSKAADSFELNRRIIFINTWTDTQLQIIEGRCNIEYGSSRTSVICKVSDSEYKRSFIGNSGQITAMVEQLEGVPVNVYHYRRTFKPQSIIPDIDYRGGSKALINAIKPDNKD